MENNNNLESLFFIALVPPDELAKEIMVLKETMAEQYQSKAALRSPPHITLHMPFKLSEKKLHSLNNALNDFVKTHSPFSVILSGFGSFAPRVIFVGVQEEERLSVLQKQLGSLMRKNFNVFNSDYKNRAFHPHVTIAFRDLKPANFKLAWEAYKAEKLERTFKAEKITLLKHNGKFWEIYEEFNFASQ